MDSSFGFRPAPHPLLWTFGILRYLLPVLSVLTPMNSQAQDRVLVVGTKAAEPFSIHDDTGAWHGISIELWEKMASELGWRYEYRELSLDALVKGVSEGSLDVAVAAITATPAREAVLDFTHPFYSTGLGIAVPAHPPGGLALLRAVASREFLTVVALLSLLLLVVGVLVWILERRRNPEQFGGSTLQGIGSGFWWSAVTMTTVGYGDKAPTTFWGRGLGLFWMFAGIIMISTFTAAISSSLTLTNLQTRVRGPADLPGARVGTLTGSAPEASLQDRGVVPRSYPDLQTALNAVKDGEIDAVVYDAPILRYRVKQGYQGEVRVLDRTFERQDYAIALPPGSELRESLNRKLLEEIRSEEWRSLLDRYLGN